MKKFLVIGLLVSLTLAGCETSSKTKSASSTETVRAIDGSGVASGKFDTVDFNISTSALSTNKEKARTRVKNTLLGLSVALSELQTSNVVFENKDTATTVNVTKEWDWENGKKVFKGFRANASVYLRTKNVKKVSAIVEKLGAVENLEMESPTFLLSDSQVDELHRSAFKNAVRRAKARFTNECETLGLQSDSFTVASWNARYDSSRNAYDEGAGLASADDARMRAKSDSVVIQGGKPKIFVTVRLQYTK